MKNSFLLFLSMLLLTAGSAAAQMFTTSPVPLQQSSADVKIYFDPAQCNVAALKTATALYAHIGVCLEGAPNEWTHVKTNWGQNLPANTFKKLSDGRWELAIGDINTYFGLSASEKVANIAVIARTASGGAQTEDVFLPVVGEGFAISFTSDASSLVIDKPTEITFSLNATENAKLSITVNGKSIGSADNAKSLTKSYNFATKGEFATVVATASNGSQSLTESMTVAYPEPSVQENYPGGKPVMGAVKQADGSVIFCIAAPQKLSAILVGSWDDYQTLGKNVMRYQDYNGNRYFWVKISGLANDKYYPYYYLIDGNIKVSDPCAKLVLDCYSDKWMPSGIWAEEMPQYPYEKLDNVMLAVYRGDIDDYDWDSATLKFKTPDTRSMTVYEILLRDFTGDGSDQNGKTYGTFRTALPKISYLKELGVNAVEILPVMEFNGNSSWGYNTNNYMALDKVYGSPRDMRDFVAECHRQGIAVILDIVFNQSDGLMPWYQMYSVGSNPFFNQTAPHAYSVLNDFNQGNPVLQDYWHQVLRYWMEAYKVDGFRFDLVKGLGDNNSYSSASDAATNAYNANRVATMKVLHDVITSVKADGIHINELLGTTQEENANFANGEIGWNNVNGASVNYAIGNINNGGTKGFYSPNWDKTFGGSLSYAESHDEPRLAWKIKDSGVSDLKYSTTTPKESAIRRLGSVAGQMLLSPGAQMIWQFGEVAADYKQGSDLEKLRAIAPLWNYFDNSVRAGLAENYKALCHLRLDNPEMFDGSATYAANGFSNSVTSPRYICLTKGDKEIIGVFNTAYAANRTATVTVPAQRISESNYQLITCGYKDTPTLTGSGNVKVTVMPNSFAVFATKNISGVEDVFASDEDADLVSVAGGYGEIIINGAYNIAEAYDLQGRAVGITSLGGGTSDSVIRVPAGIYIVRVDNTTHKVAVR